MITVLIIALRSTHLPRYAQLYVEYGNQISIYIRPKYTTYLRACCTVRYVIHAKSVLVPSHPLALNLLTGAWIIKHVPPDPVPSKQIYANGTSTIEANICKWQIANRNPEYLHMQVSRPEFWVGVIIMREDQKDAARARASTPPLTGTYHHDVHVAWDLNRIHGPAYIPGTCKYT